jgi:probable rRNA maturation factor
MDNPPSKKIQFYFSDRSFSLKDRSKLKFFIENICIKEKQKLQKLTFIFCNNKKIKKLNKEFLNHNYNTDILTFPLSHKNSPLVADIYISQEQVLQNARTFNASFKMEIHRVIFHGVLHLCGYEDKTGRQVQEMREMENKWLDQYFNFVSRGT